MNKRYFEDLAEGEHLCCKTVKITKERILSFAAEFDPQPFHTSEKPAQDSIFDGLIASSLHTLSACTKVVVDALEGVQILSGIGMDEVKMTTPVRPGDTLTVEAWWTKLRLSRTKADFGFGTVRCHVINQNGEPVVDYGYQYIIKTIRR